MRQLGAQPVEQLRRQVRELEGPRRRLRRDVQCPVRRELRLYGSQGEQRLAVLALLLAEADAIADRRDAPPLLLLDDVLSELDEERRDALVELLPAGGQTVMTATAAELLPRAPDQLVAVSAGTAVTR